HPVRRDGSGGHPRDRLAPQGVDRLDGGRPGDEVHRDSAASPRDLRDRAQVPTPGRGRHRLVLVHQPAVEDRPDRGRAAELTIREASNGAATARERPPPRGRGSIKRNESPRSARAAMHVLFYHQNYPAQFGHLARELAARPGWRVTFVSKDGPAEVPGLT